MKIPKRGAWAAGGAFWLVFTLAGAAAAADAIGVVRDIRPTTLERGDTLVIECEGIRPSGLVSVRLFGLRAGTPVSVALLGRSSSGDRVLVDIDDDLATRLGGPFRLSNVAVEVHGISDGRAHRWETRAGVAYELDLFPVTLRAAIAKTVEGLRSSSALLAQVPGGVLAAVLLLLAALLLHLMLAPVTGVLVVWERKIAGRMQSRFGPNRVGPSGWLQWLADGIKLIGKEDLIPGQADRKLFRFAPYLIWMGVFAAFVVLPLSHLAVVADMNIGLLYLVSVTSFSVIAIMMGGWASNSKWSLLGGMRAAAQIVSYELPGSLALLQVVLLAGTLSLQGIVRAQGGLPHEWFLFDNPFSFVCFFIFFMAALAEANRTPFDLPEAESELVAGYATEYSGFRFTIFSLAEWTNLIVIGAVVATVFLGGWNLPFVTPDRIQESALLHALSVAVMLFKIIALVFVIIWVRWTLPRLRVDQLMGFSWKVLTPLALLAFVATAGWLVVTSAFPVLGLFVRWLTFLLGGVGVAILFALRVRKAWRHTHLLYRGKRQVTVPWTERPAERI